MCFTIDQYITVFHAQLCVPLRYLPYLHIYIHIIPMTETTVHKLRMDEGTGIRQDVEDGNRVTMEWCVRRLCRKQCLFYYSESLHIINLEVG